MQQFQIRSQASADRHAVSQAHDQLWLLFATVSTCMVVHVSQAWSAYYVIHKSA